MRFVPQHILRLFLFQRDEQLHETQSDSIISMLHPLPDITVLLLIEMNR